MEKMSGNGGITSSLFHSSFVENNFIKESEKIRSLGSGTFGSVGLYNTQYGKFVIKETKMMDRSLGYPPDFLTEIDMLLKFRSVDTVVRIEGVYFDIDTRKGYILLESMDTNLSKWINKNNFRTRIREIPNLIDMIGGTLAIMQHFGCVHNDIKTNNILVKNTPDGLLFKLADFGKSVCATGSHDEYGAITKYLPPTRQHILTSEYWAFMMCLVEMIMGEYSPRGKTIGEFYDRFESKKRFDLPKALRSVLTDEEYHSIPSAFWKFVSPLIMAVDISKGTHSLKTTITDGLRNDDIVVNEDIIQLVRDSISWHEPMSPRYELVKDEFESRIRSIHGINHTVGIRRFRRLLNKFLCIIGNEKFDLIDLKHYAEVVYIIIVKKKDMSFQYFDSVDNFLLFQRALLAKIGYQSIILEMSDTSSE